MKIYLLSPENVPMNQVLFPTMIKTFEFNGNPFVDMIEHSDCVLMDLHSRQFDYKQEDIDWVVKSNSAITTFCEWDRGNLSSDVWPHPLTKQHESIFNSIYAKGKKAVHFCRLLDKTKTYRGNLYPYEKPILYEEDFLSADELFNREYDVVFIANQSPSRDAIAEALRSDGRLKSFISIGAAKIPFDEFVRIHKLGKLFVSSGAGGYTDERKQHLFSIAGLVQEETNQLLLHPFTHLENCIKISSPPTKNELDTIYEMCNNKEGLYEIYKNGYEFMKKYYSKEHIASNILETIKKHL